MNKSSKIDLELHEKEQAFLKEYFSIIGIDEVGRGCMAGPMVVVGCKIDKDSIIHRGVNDSKVLSSKKRELLYPTLIQYDYKLVEISPKNIDSEGLTKVFENAVIEIINHFGDNNMYILDGNVRIKTNANIVSEVDADANFYSVAAASIIAKEYRDTQMKTLSKQYPEFEFDKHVGYCTAKHIQAVKDYGIIEGIHRKSYKPISKILKSYEKS